MKQSLGEMKMENEQLVRDFVLAAFEKKQLAEQIDSFYDSMDDLGADLEIESQRLLFQNASEHMKKLAAKLATLENRLDGMLPTLMTYRESLAKMPQESAIQKIHAIAVAASEEAKPIRPAQVKPDTPTLMALEPAPLLGSDEYDEEYGSEEYGSICPESGEVEEPSFDHPAPPVIESSSFSQEDTEAFSLHKLGNDDITPPVLFESVPDEPLSLGIPLPSSLAERPIEQMTPPHAMDASAESWARPPLSAKMPDSEVADAGSSNALSNEPVSEVSHSDETVVGPAPLPETDDSEVPLSDEEKEAIEALELSDVEHELSDDVEPEYEFASPAPGEPGNLASVLEPDSDDELASTMPSDAINNTQWDDDEPPTGNLVHSLEGTTEEAHILFWKQKAAAPTDKGNTATNEVVEKSISSERHSTMCSAVAAISDGAETMVADVEKISHHHENDENLDHIGDYDDSDEELADSSAESDGIDLDVDAGSGVDPKPTEREGSLELESAAVPLDENVDDTLEQELFQLIDSSSANVMDAPEGAKQTLMGLGHSTIEKVNALSVEDTQPVSHVDRE